MNILFVCKYNVFRSKVAEAYFNRFNKNKNIKAKSAGLIAGGSPPEKEAASVKNSEMLMAGKPKGLNVKLLKWQDITIIVADDVPPSIFNRNEKYGKKTIVWDIKDASSDGENVPEIMNQIKEKVVDLIKDLEETK